MEVLAFHEHVRRRPGMYVGDTHDGSGANHLVLELVANALDQHLAGHLSTIEIAEDGHRITIKDDGPGLPFLTPAPKGKRSLAEEAFEVYHSNATAHGHAPHVHVMFRGVGLVVVNALSERVEISSSNGTYLWRHRYHHARPYGAPEVAETKAPSGTEMTFVFEKDLLAPCDRPRLHTTLRDTAALYPELEITFNDERFGFPQGLADRARTLLGTDHSEALWHRETYEDFHIDLALLGARETPLHLNSWVNGVSSPDGGTHVDALNAALKQHGWEPAIIQLHVIMQTPKYAGPCKDILETPDLAPAFQSAFETILKEH